MIRSGFNTPLTEEDLYSDDEFEGVINKVRVDSPKVRVDAVVGKRKLVDDKEHTKTLQRLESLDLESEDEDVLVLDETDEEALLRGSEDCDLPSVPPRIKAKRVIQKESSNDDAEMKTGDADRKVCPMKWMRTVGIKPGGTIQCTVSTSSTALETMSDSGTTESVMADTIRAMIDVYQKKRADIVDRNGVLATPLHVVKKLALDHGETLHCEITSFPNGYHRLELFSGHVRGIGEGITKRLAAQMAAIDLLERVQLSQGTVKVPRFGFLPGWLTSNSVFGDLNALCQSMDLPRPKITAKLNLTEDGLVDPSIAPHVAECWVGEELVTIGKSETELFAKREAAREMYAVIAKVDYKDVPYAIGKCCRRAPELTAAGYRPVMSDYKKKWLLQNRVTNRQLDIPEEEVGLEEVFEIQELEKDLENIDDLGYELMKKKIKVTVKNKKLKTIDEKPTAEPSASDTTRRVSVENQEEEEDPDDW